MEINEITIWRLHKAIEVLSKISELSARDYSDHEIGFWKKLGAIQGQADVARILLEGMTNDKRGA